MTQKSRRKGGSRRRGGSSARSSRKPTRSWTTLSPKEKLSRRRSLEVIRLMRSGDSFTSGCRLIGIDTRAAKGELRGFIYKKRRRWKAKAKDKISRGLTIYENGRIKHIIVNDSEVASIIGEYFNDVKKVLETGEILLLKKYRKLILKDSSGKKHRLETHLKNLREIELSKEDIEFSDLYD